MEERPQKAWWQPALEVFTQIIGWLAVPVIAALFLGRYLDERYDSEPWFFLGLTAAAFIISLVGLVRVGVRYMKKAEEAGKKKIEKNHHNEPNSRHNN